MRRFVLLVLVTVFAMAVFAKPAMASYARPTIAEAHKWLGVNLATHYSQPYWTYDGTKLLSNHSGTNWTWHNLGVSVSEYTPYWMTYPTNTRGYGVFYSKMKFGVGITRYGLPLGYDWYCQIAAHCYYSGYCSYGEICDFN